MTHSPLLRLLVLLSSAAIAVAVAVPHPPTLQSRYECSGPIICCESIGVPTNYIYYSLACVSIEVDGFEWLVLAKPGDEVTHTSKTLT